jgi:putative two-component system response regulator
VSEAELKSAPILVVDDEQANVMLLERVLQQSGYSNLVATTDSSQVVALCERLQPDLLLLDLHMPEPDGFELMRLLAPWTAKKGYLPILVLTADVSQEAKQQALSMGAQDFLTKPLDPIEVRLRVNNLLETRQLHTQLQRHNELLEQRVRVRTSDLEQSRLEILDRLALAAEYRDDDTHQHAQRIGRTAGLLAVQLKLGAKTASEIRRAAPLHDIGKIGIPDQILLKPGNLTPDEFEVIKTHTTIGAQMLSGSQAPLLQMAEQIALTHHERWDGTGYPVALASDQIPISGRIVAVADVFDALAHERPYKQAWPLDEVLAELSDQSGRQFDPAVIDAFQALDHAALLEPFSPIHPALTLADCHDNGNAATSNGHPTDLGLRPAFGG